jgi:integrase
LGRGGRAPETNPIAGLKKRAKEAASTRTLSDPEIRVLWTALSTTQLTSVDVAEPLKVLLLTGQRPGEVAGAAQSELLDLTSPTLARWDIPANRMKARRPHVVPLAPMARQSLEDALARRRAEADRSGVFASRFLSRDTLARHSLSQALRRIIRELPPSGPDSDAVATVQADAPTPHDFRRTVATGLAALGVPREDRKAVLAHLPGDIHGAVYDRYERLKEKRATLEAWEKHLTAILERQHG